MVLPTYEMALTLGGLPTTVPIPITHIDQSLVRAKQVPTNLTWEGEGLGSSGRIQF